MRAKNPSQILQPTPVRSAIRNIRFIVPRNRFLVPSKLSFIFSAKAVESRISSPIAIVICHAYQLSMPCALYSRGEQTFFSILTFSVIIPTCSSF